MQSPSSAAAAPTLVPLPADAGEGRADASPAHLAELYRQAMREQQEYGQQRDYERSPEPSERPKTQSPTHDELLRHDEVDDDRPTEERLPPEAWSSPQPWRCVGWPPAFLVTPKPPPRFSSAAPLPFGRFRDRWSRKKG